MKKLFFGLHVVVILVFLMTQVQAWDHVEQPGGHSYWCSTPTSACSSNAAGNCCGSYFGTGSNGNGWGCSGGVEYGCDDFDGNPKTLRTCNRGVTTRCQSYCTRSYGNWSACSVSCGGGTRSRDDGCGGSQSEDCNTQACCVPSKTCADYPNQCGTNLNNGCTNSLNCSQYCPAEDVPPTGDWCCNGNPVPVYQSVLEVQTSTGIQKIRGTQQ